MRVTNINLTDKLLRNIQDAQKAQLEAQEQVATNQKITKPSDDGVKFGRVTKLESEKRELIQYRRNNGHAEDIINASILNLEKLQELNVRAMEIARIGASGVNQNSYSAYVEEVDQLLEEAVNRSNASFQGNFLFAGTKTSTKPFVKTTESGSGAVASASTVSSAVTAISLSSAGTNYNLPPKVTIADNAGVGSGASATAVINGVPTFHLINGGSGYATTDTVSVSPPAAAWTASSSYSVGDRVMVGTHIYRATQAGTSGSTTLSHTSGEATDGSVNWQHVLSDAQTASVSISTVSASGNTSGIISALSVTTAGKGYDTPPTISFSSTAGSGAIANSQISGSLAEIIVDSTGSNYSSASVTITTEDRIAAVSYDGNTNSAEFYIGNDSKISAHLDSNNNSTFVSAIKNLMDLRNALDGDNSKVPESMISIESSLQNYEDDVLGQLAELSGKQLRVKSSSDFESQLFLQKEQQISNDVDIDLAEAMIKLTRAQTAYTVALQTSSGLLGNSLLDYI